ncbi:MAG: Ig-like domain-containing protein [Lentihominibacter sp.]
MSNDFLKKHKVLISLIVLCLIAFGVLVFVDGPKVITKQVKGLEVKQEGLSLDAVWNEMDCSHYMVTVTCEGKKAIYNKVEENSFTVEYVEPGKTYNIEVVAILDSGEYSRSQDADIRAEKLRNSVKVNTESFEGFKKDSFKIEARGIGDIEYSSDNEKVAKVDSKGRVRLLKAGHAEITVSAYGDSLHGQGQKTVKVTVYPEHLGQVEGVTVKNTSDSTATISWKALEYAGEYRLMKISPANGKAEEIKRIDRGATSVEINRAAGRYAILPEAVIGDKTIQGSLSEPVTVKSVTEDMKSYSSWTNLKTLRRSNLKLFRTVRGDGNCRVPQSISITRDCYVISYVNSSGTAGKLCSYRKSDGKCIDITPCSGMGHANGTTYDPYKDKFYVVKTHKSYRTASCSVYNGTTKKSEGAFNLPRVTSGIAYDESSNKYYLSKGNEIYVCDSRFNVEKFIHKKIRYNHAQDIGAYNGIVFVCTWVNGNTSYIDMYRASDGAYLGGYDVSFGEVESCVVDDGYLVILMNNASGDGDAIYKTTERLPID